MSRKNKIGDVIPEGAFNRFPLTFVHEVAHFDLDREVLDNETYLTGSALLKNLNLHNDYAVTFKLAPLGTDRHDVLKKKDINFLTIKRVTPEVLPVLFTSLSCDHTILGAYATDLEAEVLDYTKRRGA